MRALFRRTWCGVVAIAAASLIDASLAIGDARDPSAPDASLGAHPWSQHGGVMPPGAGVLIPEAPDLPEPAACFGPGTPVAEVEEAERRQAERSARRARESRERAEAAGLAAPAYQVDGQWSWTATNQQGRSSGSPVTLTWSIVPDGTTIPGGNGEPQSPSNLVSFLDDNFGPQSFWLPTIASVFERWGELTGVTYVYSPVDDGASFPSSPGVLGVRGDVRISGHAINGTGGVIGYNWYPNLGDMVLDTADGNFGWGVPLLKNVMSHEHGHGLGFDHVCPLEHNKLMEPIATTAFDGPQHDDIRAGNRAYGDDFEPNDVTGNATDLGALGDDAVVVDGASIHQSSDVDLYRVTVAAGRTLSAILTPVGQEYLEGPQLSGGACSAGSSIDSRVARDLALSLLAGDGTTVLATALAKPAGDVEELASVELPGAGTYFVRVVATASDAVQMYDLDLTSAPSSTRPEEIFADDFESGGLDAWDARRAPDPELAVVAEAAMAGTDLGLRIALGDRAWLVDRTPRREARYRARFWIDARAFAPIASRDRLTVLELDSSRPTTEAVVFLDVRRRDGHAEVQARVRRDDGSFVQTRFATLPDAPAAVEIEWVRASSPDAHDGMLRLWIDGTTEAAAPARKVTGLDNDERGIDTVRLGAIAVPAGAQGTLYLDRFESRRSSFIGP